MNYEDTLVWRCHAHDNGFNWEGRIPEETWQEPPFQPKPAKEYTPCLAFETREGRDQALQILLRHGFEHDIGGA